MLSISWQAKTKHGQPAPTHVEVDSAPISFAVMLVSAGIAACIFMLALLLVIDFLHSRSDRRFWQYLSAASLDDQAHAMGKVMSGAVANADIVMFGTSGLRESTLIDDDLNARLRQLHASPVSVANLATGAQTLAETLLLAEAGPPQPGQTHILFFSISQLQHARPFHAIEQGGFMRSPETLIEKYEHRSIFPMDWNSFGVRLLLRVRAGREQLHRHLKNRLKYEIHERVYGKLPPTYMPYRYQNHLPVKPETKAELMQDYASDLKQNIANNVRYMESTLNAIADELRDHKCRLVIASPPEFNGEIQTAFPNEYGVLNEMVQRLRVNHQIEQLDLNTKIKWDPNDFVDLVHVTESGREKWSAALLEWLAQQPLRQGH